MSVIDEEAAFHTISAPLTLTADDAYPLAAHVWYDDARRNGVNGQHRGVVVINPATAVKASYYHRYARFLAEHGFVALTFDYRGIGDSRQGHLRNWKHITKTDWGRFDCEAALVWALQHHAELPLYAVTHSIGGMVIGLAPSNRHVVRCLSVGAQYAYWPDYAAAARRSMWMRWHLLMPVLTALFGYFPAKFLGWHEDLPAGAAYEWAFRGERLGGARGARPNDLANFRGMTADILAIGISDDDFGTPEAINRLLTYFENSRPHQISITPSDIGLTSIGHFAYFHEKFRDTLWCDSLCWLADGEITFRFQK